ncbi:MAG: hypothetical protein GY922_02090 [Proteobacteria bacterium]|nr:hypothetical protein [Pseudomonadota bacterium]
MLLQKFGCHSLVLLAWGYSRNAQIRRAGEVCTGGKQNAPSRWNAAMPPMVFSGELIHPAIKQLANRATGKIPFFVSQRDFRQLVIHGPIGSKADG